MKISIACKAIYIYIYIYICDICSEPCSQKPKMHRCAMSTSIMMYEHNARHIIGCSFCVSILFLWQISASLLHRRGYDFSWPRHLMDTTHYQLYTAPWLRAIKLSWFSSAPLSAKALLCDELFPHLHAPQTSMHGPPHLRLGTGPGRGSIPS
jgi:hypothetical protein